MLGFINNRSVDTLDVQIVKILMYFHSTSHMSGENKVALDVTVASDATCNSFLEVFL